MSTNNITAEAKDRLQLVELDPQIGLNEREAAKLLGLAANTLRAYRNRKKSLERLSPPFQKIGNKVIYIKADILAWRDRVAIRYCDMEVT